MQSKKPDNINNNLNLHGTQFNWVSALTLYVATSFQRQTR
jgi:hypothetical protein